MLVRIRPADAADLPAVSRVHATTWRAAYAGVVPDSYLADLSPDVSLARRRQRYPDYPVLPHGEELVAEVDGGVVGFVSVGRVRDDGMPAGTGEVWALYVLPEHQGGGVGSALLAAGIARLRALGFGTVVLWVLTLNASARAYYGTGSSATVAARAGIGTTGRCRRCATGSYSAEPRPIQERAHWRPTVNRIVSRPCPPPALQVVMCAAASRRRVGRRRQR